jgi:AraC-like DNA-binding protein
METILEVVSSFQRVFACNVCIHDYDGLIRRFSSSLAVLHINPFCDYVKKNKTQNMLCGEFDGLEIRSKLALERTPFLKICNAGVIEAVFPLFAGSHIFAAMFVGPFRRGRIGSEEMHKMATDDSLFVPTEKICTLKKNLRVLHSSEFSDLINMASLLALRIESDILSSDSNENERDPARRIKYFIEREFRNKLKISDLASFLCLSESRVCQIIREKFDKSFVMLLTERRIEHAKHLLVTSYLKTLSVAGECGFSDPTYFFRVFRRYNKGKTPGEYRNETKGVKYI